LEILDLTGVHPMRIRRATSALLLLASLFALGCSKGDPNRKETVQVSGEVFVAGEPAEGVMVAFYPEAGMDKAQPTDTKALTNAEGKFSASTYEVGDGVPLGKYQVTFTWPKLNKISMTFDGDQFKGKYAKPEKSEFSIDVQSGQPIDMGRIELKLK
jgi:5-hydroxyisourate hydrolase-like protein (transthyretin family)